MSLKTSLSSVSLQVSSIVAEIPASKLSFECAILCIHLTSSRPAWGPATSHSSTSSSRSRTSPSSCTSWTGTRSSGGRSMRLGTDPTQLPLILADSKRTAILFQRLHLWYFTGILYITYGTHERKNSSEIIVHLGFRSHNNDRETAILWHSPLAWVKLVG